MPDRRECGKIILIHGASSSGKTTLSRAVQQRLEEPFWHFSIDHLREAGVLPMERIRTGEFAWPSLRPAFFDGFHRCLPVLAESGNNLIVEHIVESQDWMSRLVQLLSDFDVFFVALRCPSWSWSNGRSREPIGGSARRAATSRAIPSSLRTISS